MEIQLVTDATQHQIGFVSPRYKFVIISNLTINGYRM